TGRPWCTAIDISLASEGARYDWTTEADTWGSDPPSNCHHTGGREDPEDQAVQYRRLASFPATAPKPPGGPGLPGPSSSCSAGSNRTVQGAREPSCARPPPPELTGCQAQG
ncbi:hypothetical protein MTO96_036624, partial [Rhipicephalus appendiculatus]